MNIFPVESDPFCCAVALDDTRVGPILIECNQMLSTVLIGYDSKLSRLVGDHKLCRPSHENHPITKWVGESLQNFSWTLGYARYLASEFNYRFSRIHNSYYRTQYIATNLSFQHDLLPKASGTIVIFPRSKEESKEILRRKWDSQERSPEWTKRQSPYWYRRRDDVPRS